MNPSSSVTSQKAIRFQKKRAPSSHFRRILFFLREKFPEGLIRMVSEIGSTSFDIGRSGRAIKLAIIESTFQITRVMSGIARVFEIGFRDVFRLQHHAIVYPLAIYTAHQSDHFCIIAPRQIYTLSHDTLSR